MFRDKNVLVTGGAGFVGSNLIERLIDLGANITASVHKKMPIVEIQGVNYIQCDLRLEADCKKAVKGMDYVFMCAANTSGAAVMEKTPLAHLTPNILMNASMLEAAYEEGVKKFLFISSNTVYPLTDFAVKESDVTNEFYDKYFIVAWMKRFTEIMCEMYGSKISKPMDVCVIRPANIYGEGDDFEWETSHVIPALVRKVVERHHPLEVWGDGKDLKEFIYIQDFIDGILLAMEKLSGFSVTNIANGKAATVKEVIDILLKVDGYTDAEVRFDTSKPTMIPKRLIDITKAREELGFVPRVDLEMGLKNLVSWYRKNKL